MLKYLTILTLFIPKISQCQSINEHSLAEIYKNSISYLFKDKNLHIDEKRFGYIIVQTDIDSTLIPKKIGTHRFKYYSSNTPKTSTCNGDSTDKGRYLYKIYHSQLSKDTIEVTLNQSVVVYDKDIYSDFLFTTHSLLSSSIIFVWNKAKDEWQLID